MLIVQKYGGSSLANPKRILAAAQRISRLKRSGRDVVVVASAMGHMTDHLIRLARRTVKHPPQRELDMLMTAGERISMSLLAMALDQEGVPAISFTGSQGGILTTSDHTGARIVDIKAHRLREELAKGRVVIVAGFQGVSREKEVTTLGRGGSDTSAVALAASLGAEYCEILTDVDGLFTADPRLVPAARLLGQCSYDEALEMAYLGAKMHPRSIEVAKKFGVRVYIRSSRNTDVPGTLIEGNGGRVEESAIRGIATKDGYSLIRAELDLDKLLETMSSRRVSLRLFTHDKGVTKFVCERESAPLILEVLSRMGVPTQELPKMVAISAVGDGICSSPDLLPKFLASLREAGAECELLTVHSTAIIAVIAADRKEAAARKLHEAFLENAS